MTNWHYYNKKGDKITVTGKELKELALRGLITQGTMVETEDGKQAPAIKVKGLAFGETPSHIEPASPSSQPVPPVENNTFTFTAEEQAEIDSFLAGYGNDMKTVDDEGKTLLHTAAVIGSVAVTKFLVSKGMDVNAKDIDGATPLYDTWKAALAEVLISNGADVNMKDNIGDTPLHDVRDIETARFLISKGADVNANNNYGYTPLHVAISYKWRNEFAKSLLVNGADVNAKDKVGDTPLHHATHAGKIDVVQFLISKGANVNAQSNDGSTPLDVAMDAGHEAIVKYLYSVDACVGNPRSTTDAQEDNQEQDTNATNERSGESVGSIVGWNIFGLFMGIGCFLFFNMVIGLIIMAIAIGSLIVGLNKK